MDVALTLQASCLLEGVVGSLHIGWSVATLNLTCMVMISGVEMSLNCILSSFSVLIEGETRVATLVYSEHSTHLCHEGMKRVNQRYPRGIRLFRFIFSKSPHKRTHVLGIQADLVLILVLGDFARLLFRRRLQPRSLQSYENE